MSLSQRLCSFRHASRQFAYICVLFAITVTMFADGSLASSPEEACFKKGNNKPYGKTYPTGDITLRVGEALEYFCILDLEEAKDGNYTVDDVLFVKGNEPVDARYQTRVNETTVRLYMENQTESEYMLYCYLQQRNQSGGGGGGGGDSNALTQFNSFEVTTSVATASNRRVVCMSWVVVGWEPREVDNYTCVSYNWQVLNCSWTPPKNYVPTKYSIAYSPKHRYSELMSCPDNDTENFCTWTLRSTPIYRKSFETFRITINGTNKLGNNEQTFFWSHYAHIVMNPPADLKVVARNTTSLTLQWDIGDFQYFPKPLLYKVAYVYTNNTDWETVYFDRNNSTRRANKNNLVTCTITGLICNTLYDIRVFMRSSLAADKYWSNYTHKLFRTSPSPPAHAPLTDVGSFQIVPNGDNSIKRIVFVYWQPLKMDEQCGDNFTYEITASRVSSGGLQPADADVKHIETDGSYAKYEVGEDEYRFEIRSSNKEGRTSDASSVVVPAATEKVQLCSSFTKTDYLSTPNCTNLYEVVWQPPPDGDGQAIQNYTVFWCESHKGWPYQCNGYLRWKTIAANVLNDSICINSTETYQFAISANTASASSGMLWATCSVRHDHLGTVRQVTARVTYSRSIEVAWTLECVDQASTIKGYKVRYCPVPDPHASACAPGTNLTETWPLNNTHLTSGTLKDLQPFTYYRVTVCMFNVAGEEGPSSLPVILPTKEGAPNVEGVKLNLMNRTNTSVTIGWEPPRRMNGLFHHYAVEWRQPQYLEPKIQAARKTQYTIESLEPYTKYNVTVKACTTPLICSAEIGPLEVSTDVGRPSDVTNIATVTQDHHTLVKWEPPHQPAGPHPFYEVLLLKNQEKVSINRTNDTHVLLPKPDCSAEHNTEYEVRVRAINVVDRRDAAEAGGQSPIVYEGDQSPALMVSCTDGVSMVWKILMWTTFPVVLMVFVGYGSRQLFYKCHEMKKVGVTVPMKFLTTPADLKGEDPFGPNYMQVVPPRQADEFSTLVDKTAEQSV